MSGSSYSFNTSFSASVSSSSSSCNSNGQRTGSSYSHQSSTDPNGTTTQTRSQKLGQSAVEERRHYDQHGRELLEAGQGHGQARVQDGRGARPQGRIEEIEVEDVTGQEDGDDAPALKYRERIEDEYAKREGGA